MKNYLIITNDSVTIDEEIKKILNDAKLTEENVIRYVLQRSIYVRFSWLKRYV